jgi:methionyl aminopeptidase
VSVEDQAELEALRAVARVVAETLRELRRRVRPTGELDAAAARSVSLRSPPASPRARYGARSGPQLDYGFPGTVCLSVDDECVHGVPGPRRLRDGQLVKLDVTAELDGFYADACVTVPVGRARPRAQRLVSAASSALRRGLAAARAGEPVGAIGAAVEDEVRRHGFAVCHELGGHGIGRCIHEPPSVPNVAGCGPALTEGLVLAVEPIIAAGGGDVHLAPDGWTIRTDDGSPSAHAEHTIVITAGAPLVLTA